MNRALYEHLLRHGTDPEVARWLAEQSEPDEDGEPGEVEATLARRPRA